MTHRLKTPLVETSADLETAETRPVRLEILDAHGVTLWSGGDSDLLLASGRHVLLFGSTWQLRHFVLSGAHSNLEERPTYRSLRRDLRRSSNQRLRIDNRVFSLNQAVSSISDGAITRRSQRQILDSLNLLWDVANTVDIGKARAVLRAPRMRGFLDALTFVEVSDADARTQLSQLDLPRVRSDIEEAMRLVRPSIEVLSPPDISVAVAG